MKEYLSLIKKVLKNGEFREDRTKVGTLSLFGLQSRYDLTKGFPLLTTKKIYFKAIVHELLWFLKGDTNIEYLVKNNVNIWNEWPYEIFKKSSDYNDLSIEEFKEKIINDHNFALKYGELGPVYGKQWRNFNGIDQIENLICNLKNDPNSRRHIVSAWDPAKINKMALPPCHTLFQLFVTNEGELDLLLYQRSGDIFLGVPFNIASYSLLNILIARECKLKPRYFIHTIGDGHIYTNHLEQVNLQIKRKPYKLPTINIKSEDNIFSLKAEDIILENYQSHPVIKGKVAV
ncbi:thymidylate synthase [Spiroplasma endosymbiont of Aspidapion aeneum]|uniref:thymidylate synthase n=1 Tax=Spiroplasma endosymbiont of Aspidapion aeneum TaxID=3066276 RepID=UPI00313BC879